MFIVKINYLAELSEIDQCLQAHRDFLEFHYKQGRFLASGPMTPRTGGIVVALVNDREEIEAIFEKDPYNIAGLVSYEFTQFTAVKSIDAIKELLRNKADANI